MLKSLNIKGKLYQLESPMVMGILNITPDSFFDGGKYSNIDKAISQISEMLDFGVDIIDIGAMSSRPGAKIIDINTEWGRLEPILNQILKVFPELIFSIDTIRAEIAERCIVDYGAAMINDISGGEFDDNMFKLIANTKTPYIIMHMRGTPETMNSKTDYDDIIIDLVTYFSKKVKILRDYGVNDIIIDPGFGFAKSIEQNYLLLNKLQHLEILELPLLIGLSRKSMVWKYLGIKPEDSLSATQVLNTIAILNGANILRVHDVKETMQTIKLIKAYLENANQ